MAGRLRATRLSRGLVIWAALCLLLSLGALTTIIDLISRPAAEALEANANGQRVIIDPVTGAVSSVASAEAPEPFDVGGGEDKNDAPSEPPPEVAATDEGDHPEPPAPAAPILPEGTPALQTEAEPITLAQLPSSKESLVAPMAPEITELGNNPLPKRGAKDASPATLYSKRFYPKEDLSYISFVFIEAGFNAATLSQIMKLPHEITVAFSPYALDPKPQIALLHTAGYETWGMLPMQGARYPQDDPGPQGIIAGQDEKTLEKRLRKVMTKTLGAVGLVLPPDEAMATRPEFAAVLKEIDARGLLVLSTHPTRSVEEITKDPELKKVIYRADLVLDANASASAIQSKLAGLKALAQQQGKLVVAVPARPQLIALISDWLKTKPLAPEVELAPLSAVYEGIRPPEPEPVEVAPAPSGGHGGGGEEKKESSGGHH